VVEAELGSEVKSVSVLVAIGVAQSGYREILAVSEGAKEDKASWTQFLRELRDRGLKGVELFVSDKCLGLVDNLAEFYPEAKWPRCIVHFYRNVWTAGKGAMATHGSATSPALGLGQGWKQNPFIVIGRHQTFVLAECEPGGWSSRALDTGSSCRAQRLRTRRMKNRPCCAADMA
jgi:hypothetical protein